VKRLLIAYAHPDDESFGLGGLIAKYVAQGVEVYYVCATNGDVGTVSPEFMRGYDTIKDLRLAELAKASEVLGFKKVYLFDYKDSGMMGADSNNDPSCLWYAWTHQPETVTRRMVDVLREVRPQVVMTFNRYGAYGHPDHIAIQRATTEAFSLAADPAYVTDALPHQAQKLYYTNIPKSSVRLGIWLLRLRGQDPRRIGRNKDIDIVAILENCEPMHTQVDIRDWYDKWDEASACHASQGGGGGFRVFPKSWRRYLTPYQSFTRVYPKPALDKIDEHDLFERVVLETQTESPKQVSR